MEKECLYPKENGEICHNEAFVSLTKVHENEPNLTLNVCIGCLNEVLDQYNLEVSELKE